jgi:hypothetical protein
MLRTVKNSVRIGEQFKAELHTGVQRTYAM